MNIFKQCSLPFRYAKYFFATVAAKGQSKKIHFIPGDAKIVDNTKHVTLRGTFLKGNYNDLPNLIFFTETLDSPSSWIPFFTNPENRILDYRNVWLLNPRNFGTSDRHPSFDLEDCANDVLRFMYQHKISTATLGGHGFGGKVALAAGCYFAERVTGVFNFDTAPLDHRYYQAFGEFKDYIKAAKEIDLKNWSSKEIGIYLKEQIKCPKWRKLISNNILENSKQPGQFYWNCGLDFIHKNVNFNKADSLANWNAKYGLFTGRVLFLFPEYSRWVHLNTNTLPILKICVRAKGFGSDILYIQGDDNPLNHWIYDFPQSSFVAARKLLKFLTLYDGVNILLQDRSEIGKTCIPDVKLSRKDSDHLYSDYSPAHVHHNWRFSNIYEEAEKFKTNPAYNPYQTVSPQQAQNQTPPKK